MKSLKYKLVIAATVLGLAIITTLTLHHVFRELPDARVTIGVHATDGFGEPTAAAMDVWNGYVGCRVFVPGTQVHVQGETGDPCGYPWRPADEQDKDATAYLCGTQYQIFISQPGDIHKQTFIIAHELGHVLRRPHSSKGVMNSVYNPDRPIRISDADVATVFVEYCE